MLYSEKVEKAEKRVGRSLDFLFLGTLIYIVSWVNFAVQAVRCEQLTKADTRPSKKN